MSWYRIVLPLTLMFVLNSTVLAKEFLPIEEDALLIRGILAEEYHAYESSYQIYKRLFDNTDQEIYLFKEVTSALLSRSHIIESIDRLQLWNQKYPNKIEVKRLLIPLLLSAREVQSAKQEAEYLLEVSEEPIDLDLASKSFFYAGEFERALGVLRRMYEKVPQEEILLRMAQIMDEFTNQRKRAIQLLETHRRINIVVSQDVYAKLLLLYQKEQDIEGILEIYKALYAQDEQKEYLEKIIEIYIYKRDINGAISFLEKGNKEDKTLYELYKRERYFTKALALIDTFYQADKNPKWIAEKGILTFEKSKNKNDKMMIKEVVDYFEKALALGVDDSIYLNYYGYTLIENNINIKKGMKIIQDALLQQPDNTYYLDSLAWGYYKKGMCQKAYSIMKRVVDEEGLSEPEILYHWNAINACR